MSKQPEMPLQAAGVNMSDWVASPCPRQTSNSPLDMYRMQDPHETPDWILANRTKHLLQTKDICIFQICFS